MISTLIPGPCNVVVYDTLASQPWPAVAREESPGVFGFAHVWSSTGAEALAPMGCRGQIDAPAREAGKSRLRVPVGTC